MSRQPPLIAHIIHHLGIGGLENGLVNLVNSIPADRYRHAIICLAGHSEFAGRIKREDVRIYDLAKRPGKDIGCYLRLYRLLRELRPDIVHTRNFGTLDCQIVAAAARVGYRIHGEHGWDVGDLHGTVTKTVVLRRMVRAFVHEYTTVSKHMANWLKNVIGIRARRITQIYNGIDSREFSPKCDGECASASVASTVPGRVVVGTVGRLDPIKDHLTLLRAFGLLVRSCGPEGASTHLVIVGAGEMQRELLRFSTEHELDNDVTFAGASDDVAGFLRTFDVFVLTSLNEGISNTILEAMATGLPVLATSVGGNPELVTQGVTGSLFTAGNADELADLLRRYVDNPELRRNQGQAGRARVVEEFGMNRMVENYLRVYDRGLDISDPRNKATG